jgi:hypothetical protein
LYALEVSGRSIEEVKESNVDKMELNDTQSIQNVEGRDDNVLIITPF